MTDTRSGLSHWLILSQIENRVLLKLVLGDVGSATSLLDMNRLNETESAIFVSLMCSLLPEDLHSELILKTPATPPLVILLLVVPRQLFCFGSLVILDVVCCSFLLLLLDIKTENR